MKERYYLFSFPEYYPSGGLGDVIKKYDSKEDAINEINFIHSKDVIDKSHPWHEKLKDLSLSDSWYLWDRIEDETIAQSND